MTRFLQIVVDGPPKGKARPRHAVSNNRAWAYKTKAAKSYDDEVQAVALRMMQYKPMMLGQLEVYITAYMPIPKSWSLKKHAAAVNADIRPTSKPDLDNIIKNLDCLNGIVFKDDAQIVKVEAVKYYSARPRLVIIVTAK